jgi:UDP-N-acetylglucosamine:LPS N-acetylglucosamine transferase
VNRAIERARLGLEAGLPTGLMLFGAQGSPKMREIAMRVGEMEANIQLVAICGHNTRLMSELGRLQLGNRMHVVGFTDQVPYYMQLCDFFIGKPGPGSISEAVRMHLPVIVEANGWTLPQERYNAVWVREQKLGIVLNSFRQINEAIEELLAPGKLAEMRQRAACLNNQAVYEIPEILAELLWGKANRKGGQPGQRTSVK